jgi:hypothetical protein
MADSKNIWAATLHADGGSFYRAPLGTALPTDPLVALPGAWKDQGWMGDDGFKLSPKRDVKKHKAFGGATVKVTQDNYECTVKATLYETNLDTLKTVFGDANVTTTFTGGHQQYKVNWTDAQLPRSSFLVRFIDGTKTGLHVIEEAQITSVEDIEYVNDKLVKYSITLDVFKPATSGHPFIYTLIDDPDDTVNNS